MAMTRLGSRGSPLALTQTKIVAAMLARATASADDQFPIQSFTTSGDRVQDRLLMEAGGKGLFTKELDEALLDRRIDAAVHSMKDLPTRLPDGIVLAAVPSREDPRDAFICLKARSLVELLPGAVLGTASLRRQAQALYLRPDLVVEPLRGSVETRLKRIEEGKFDATFLAMAGLVRLNLVHHASSVVDSEAMPPAPCQGALAITCREDDARTRELLARISIAELEVVTAAERAFLTALDGSCRTPIGALATITGAELSFLGEVLTPDGKHRWRRNGTALLGDAPMRAAETLGHRLGAEIAAAAGDAYRAHFGDGGW
jgi:hydroxymethylbilane synthase